MKYFRIVHLTGNAGFSQYRVQHRVRIFGVNLWWSSTWFWHEGGADYDLIASDEGEARRLLNSLLEDYAKKRECIRGVIIYEEGMR